MIYAVVEEDGTVSNRIELEPENLADYARSAAFLPEPPAGIIADTKEEAQVGGRWDGKKFVGPGR